MSKEAVHAFRQVLHNDSALQSQFSTAYQEGPKAVVALGAAHGFDFTESEFVEEAERLDASGELSDAEMEMVSAGGTPTQPASTDTGTTRPAPKP